MKKKQKPTFLEKFLHWIGTPQSLLVHTIIFALFVACIPLWGVERIMSVFTNLLSVEAIYLAILIQMTVNRQTEKLRAHGKRLEDIEENVDDILEDTEELTEEEENQMPA